MQMKHAKTFCFLLLIFAVLAGCATTSPSSADYRPDMSVVQQMSANDARRIVASVRSTLLPTGCAFCSYSMSVEVSRVFSDHVEFKGKHYDQDTPPMIFRFASLEPGVNHMLFLGDTSEVLLNSEWRLLASTYEDGIRLAKALYVLKQSVSPAGIADDEMRFEQAVRAHRDASTSPELSENVRRLKIQAESVLRDKKFDDAASLYGEALSIAPWWPEGHFNRALVLGEIGDYKTAILEMKRYLRLEPNAPNARTVQDKIYEWESKVK